MIHRPPEQDYEQFIPITDPAPKGMWLLYLFAFLSLGLAMSALITRSRGWSPHERQS